MIKLAKGLVADSERSCDLWLRPSFSTRRRDAVSQPLPSSVELSGDRIAKVRWHRGSPFGRTSRDASQCERLAASDPTLRLTRQEPTLALRRDLWGPHAEGKALGVLARWIVDTEPSKTYPLYTRANIGEVYPEPMSPLAATLQFRAADEGWRDLYLRYSMRQDELDMTRPEVLGCFGGYVYLNISLARLSGIRMPGVTIEEVDHLYFGKSPGLPPHVPGLADQDLERSGKLTEWVFGFLAKDDLPELQDDQREVDRLVASRPDLRLLAESELIGRMRDCVPVNRRLFERHMTVSAAAAISVGAVTRAMDGADIENAAIPLLGQLGAVDSAEPAIAIWHLSRLVSASDRLSALFDAGVDDLLDRLELMEHLSDVGDFKTVLSRFIAAYGARGPNEWELRSKTWETHPVLVLSAIDRVRLAPEGQAPTERTALLEEFGEAAQQARVGMGRGDGSTAMFDLGLRSARVHLRGRERTKTSLVRVIHEQRLAARELGRRAVERGTVDAVEKIFMLKDAELDEYVEYPVAWSDVLYERERQYMQMCALEPPFVITGEGPPLSEWSRREDRELQPASTGSRLQGLPGSPGSATGTARVVMDPVDPSRLQPGDVLVAPVTDPAWTPLFLAAKAVVVDVGAPVSHAVIVCRELGIPCVVSVLNATRRIPDGATVTVDGAAGIVDLSPTKES